jgi:phage terminase large subunit-like protein
VTLDIPTRWSSSQGRWESADGRFYFDSAAADRACEFFPDLLRHHIGEFVGQPFALMEYQAKLQTRPIFGWKRVEDGLRRFRKMFGFIPKGGGKSPWAAGTGIYLARFDNEAAAEVYAVANDRQQARTVHDNAKIMVEESRLLSMGCENLKDSIYWRSSRSMYMVLSSDASTAHGKRPHGVIFDEFHGQKNRDLYEALKKSLSKRRQPLLIMITHAGDDDEGICYEEYDYAKNVLSGLIPDDTCLPIIFEMTPQDDWTDPVVWKRVNPGHGITVKHDGIAQECLEAQHEPRKLNDFLRFHGNRWVNQATAWIPSDWWDACEGPLDDAELVTLECAAGLDLAQKWDLACFCVTFRKYLETAEQLEVIGEEATGAIARRTVSLNYRLYVRPFFWIPENTMRQHEKNDGVPYSQWVKDGLVTATEGDIIDYTRIYNDITTKILPRYPRLKQGTVGYDPAFATDIATKLRDVGGLQILEVLQNYKMFSEPSQIIEALIKGKRVTHDGHRVLRWNWENAAVKTDDAGRIRPVKPRNASKRVDGAVAMIMGDKALSMQQPPKEPEYQMIFVGGKK